MRDMTFNNLMKAIRLWQLTPAILFVTVIVLAVLVILT